MIESSSTVRQEEEEYKRKNCMGRKGETRREEKGDADFSLEI